MDVIAEELECFSHNPELFSELAQLLSQAAAKDKRLNDAIYGELIKHEVKADGKPLVVMLNDLDNAKHQSSIADLFEKIKKSNIKIGEKFGYRIVETVPYEKNGKQYKRQIVELLAYVPEEPETVPGAIENASDKIAIGGSANNPPPSPPSNSGSTELREQVSRLFIPLGVGEQLASAVIWSVLLDEIVVLKKEDLSETSFALRFGAQQIMDAGFRKLIRSKDGFEEELPDYREFREAICELCRQEGRYLDRADKACGVYCNPEKPDELFINSAKVWDRAGNELPRVDRPARSFVFKKNGDLGNPFASVAATKADVRKILKTLRTWNWKRKADPLYVLGWIALSAFVGALDWRSHLFCTAEPGSGKSKLLEFISALIVSDNQMSRAFDGTTTEAGLRQRLDGKALGILIDEFENMLSNDKKLESICQMFTSASTGSKVAKGTKDGNGRDYDLCFSAFCVGVNLPKRSHALTSRSVVLELDKVPAKNTDKAKEAFAFMAQANKLRMPIFRRMIDAWPAFRANRALVEKLMLDIDFTNRSADTIGAFVSAAGTIWFGGQMNERQARWLIKAFELNQPQEIVEENRHECLSYLLEQTIQVEPEEGKTTTQSVSEVARKAIKERAISKGLSIFDHALAKHGLGVIKRDSVIHLFVTNNHSGVRKLFKETVWDSNYAMTLQRVEGTFKDQKRIAGIPKRGMCIPTPILETQQAFEEQQSQKPEKSPFEILAKN